MLHIHVAEAAYEGEQTRALHGAAPIELLERWEVLTERLVAIHAIYLSDAEKKLLAARGSRIVHNPTTNEYLGDGICDIPRFRELRVPIALGTDADVKPSLIDEMRTAALLQKVAQLDGAALDALAVFDFATRQGAQALSIDCGAFSPRRSADYMVIDASKLDPWAVPINGLVYRGETNWIAQAFVHGKEVWSGEETALQQQSKAAVGKIARRLDLGR